MFSHRLIKNSMREHFKNYCQNLSWRHSNQENRFFNMVRLLGFSLFLNSTFTNEYIIFLISLASLIQIIGENGTKFYIIIQGSVYILLKKRQIVGQSVNETLNLSNRNMSKKDLLLFSNRETSEEVKIKKLESCYQGFLPPKTLSTGESFGEIALQISGNRF